MLADEEHPTVGGKRPRTMFRKLPGPPNFAVVNFLDNTGSKTSEQEIVPISWIINGRQPKCFWPKDTTLSRRKMDNLIMSEVVPTKEQYRALPVRILHSGCTYSEAKDKFETLAFKSNSEDNTYAIDIGEDINQNTDFEVSDIECEPEQPAKKRKKIEQSQRSKPKKLHSINKQSGKTDKKVDNGLSFEFSDFDQMDHSVDRHTQRAKTSSNRSQGNGVATLPASTCTVSRSLFPTKENLTAVDYVTRGEFLAFETKVFHKLNIIQQMVVDVNQNTKVSPQARELISFPSTISEKCQLPAKDIKTLETLDLLLKDGTISSELATYLSQLGGRSASDFLSRSLPKVVSDEVCCMTNWSGSAIPEGSLDIEGNVILREFKKTFSNLTNLVDMFCESSRLVSPTTTDKVVESYIKKWLLTFKDRISPRKHAPINRNSPKKKRSPKKKKKND